MVKSNIKTKTKTKTKEMKDVSKEKFSERAYRYLKWPNFTEKSINLTAGGKYVFIVNNRANKVEIKKMIGEVYGVKVKQVNIVNLPPKPKRIGRSQGYKSGKKKAVVSLAEGEKIEL